MLYRNWHWKIILIHSSICLFICYPIQQQQINSKSVHANVIRWSATASGSVYTWALPLLCSVPVAPNSALWFFLRGKLWNFFYQSVSHPVLCQLQLDLRVKSIKMGNSFHVIPFAEVQFSYHKLSAFGHPPVSLLIIYLFFIVPRV